MSKKELLERIARAPADAKVKRVEGVGAPASGVDAVTTRVSGRVVRRRARNEPEPVVEAVTVVRRRPALDLTAPDASMALPPAAEVEEPLEERPAEAPLVQVEAPDEEPEPRKVVLPPEPISNEPVYSASPSAEPASFEEPEESIRVEEPPPSDVMPAQTWEAEESAPEGTEAAVPERPRFEGLGRAVVMPPPGYDPTNPAAYRRRLEQRQPAGPPRVTIPPAVDEAGHGRRRRIETEEPRADADDRARRGRRARTTAPIDAMGLRRRPRRKVAVGQKVASPGPKASKRKIRIDNVISVGQLSHELGVKAAVIIKELMTAGRMATVNEMLDLETAALIASQFDYEVENVGFQEKQFLQHVADEAEEVGLQSRPPVVTIMGHVDHGKTTLLDAIRESKVAAGEAGGITQHVGAYQVDADGQAVTFIDTPGHAAFTQMRARGASVTDVVVLVVAADDGVQAQTEEAIAHAKAAEVPIVVAVNKMDKPGATVDPIKQRLADIGLVPEDWGGDTMFVPVSALKHQGIDQLLEAILLQAEVLELRANPDRYAEGVVIEARLERGRGALATLLVQRGTLKRGDNLVLGSTWGRVRAMLDHTGKPIKEAGPSTPVEIFGLQELPEVGDAFEVAKAEKDARTVADHRSKEKREAALGQPGRRTAADLFAQADATELKHLNLILKADVQGSLEALKQALLAIEVEGTEIHILHAAAGDVSESDVTLAAANSALLLGFNVRVDPMARHAAEEHGVKPEIYDVIYGLIDRVTAVVTGLVAPETHEVRQGTVEVRQLFAISKIGKIAGCHVLDGKVARSHTVRVVRGGRSIWEGKLRTLKRFKEDVREVAAGYDCGLGLDGFDAFEAGDLLETYTQEEISA